MNTTLSFSVVAAELLRQGHRLCFRPTGSSMAPAIKDGDSVLVEPVALETIKRHDVILYEVGNRLFAHRVITIQRKNNQISLILRGDAATLPDLPILPQQILGLVVAVEKQGQWSSLKSRPNQFYYWVWATLRRCKWRLQTVWQGRTRQAT